MANKHKNKKGFAKLKTWQKAGIIVLSVIILMAAGLVTYNILTPEEVPITAEYLLSGHLARETFGSRVSLSGNIANSLDAYTFVINDNLDADTDHMDVKCKSPDNNENFEAYIEKVDKKLGIYHKTPDGWRLLLKPVTSSVDNPLTDFIEIDAVQSDNIIMDALSELTLDESENEYIVTGKISFTGLLTLLGNITQVLYATDAATPFAYLTKYGDYLYADIRFMFDKETYLIKEIRAGEDETSINAVAAGMVQNRENIVKKFEFVYEVTDTESCDVYVPTDVTNYVLDTMEIKSLYTE